jgi:thiamine-phosphate pyrophosphorylase
VAVPVFPARGLYAIVDTGQLRRRGIDPIAFTDAVLAGRPRVLQLRAKELGARQVLALLRAIVPRCRAAGVLSFANDRADLALLAGCDGVHVGQDDMPAAAIRMLSSALLIGVSTHSLSQLQAALPESPAYVAFGPIYPTQSKSNPDPVVGEDGLAGAIAASSIPVVAIGGINEPRAPRIAKLGALAATIGGLLPDEHEPLGGVTDRARRLSRALEAT